ncbi:MAG: metallophosphoesterase [Clostridia bacterium]|nr:metallophosphoesterase [Clostridia bacterium]
MEKYLKPQEQTAISLFDKERELHEESLIARVWLISDLQQSIPEKAKRSLYTALEDFYEMKLKCDRIWYMGDSIEGSDMKHLEEMTAMQQDAFEKLGIPLCYVMGNHDMDIMHKGKAPVFYNMVKAHKDWKCIDKCDDFYFEDTIGSFNVVFLSDHYAKDLSWWACHGRVYGDESGYPHSEKDLKALSERIKNSGKKTLTVSHYSYPGGNRASNFLGMMMPLPENVFMHIYGHSHIGDFTWAGKDVMRKISWVNDCDIPQVDIASLEKDRGNAIRSAFLEIYPEAVKISFRDHDRKMWTESFTKAIFNS